MVSLPPCEAKAPRNSREVRRNFCGRKRGFPKIQPLYPGDFRRKHSEKIHFYQRFTEKSVHLCCRSPHGERGLKLPPPTLCCPLLGRSPHGERGLKSENIADSTKVFGSLPPRGAWIEITDHRHAANQYRSLPPRGAWIEIAYRCYHACGHKESLPPRGAWIEIAAPLSIKTNRPCRSPHGERGLKFLASCSLPPPTPVAPPTGSVD